MNTALKLQQLLLQREIKRKNSLTEIQMSDIQRHK